MTIKPSHIIKLAFWLFVEWVRNKRGLQPRDNCATWAIRNTDFGAGDGLMVSKSVSGNFPHVRVAKRVSKVSLREFDIEEFVPVKRVRQHQPPAHFDGRVLKTSFERKVDIEL